MHIFLEKCKSSFSPAFQDLHTRSTPLIEANIKVFSFSRKKSCYPTIGAIYVEHKKWATMCLRIRLTRQPGVCRLQPRDAEAQSIRGACRRKYDTLFLITVPLMNPCLEFFVNKENQLHSVHPMGWLFRTSVICTNLGKTHTHTHLTRAGNKNPHRRFAKRLERGSGRAGFETAGWLHSTRPDPP